MDYKCAYSTMCARMERLQQDKTESTYLATFSKGKTTNLKRKKSMDKKNITLEYISIRSKRNRIRFPFFFFCEKGSHTKKECSKYVN